MCVRVQIERSLRVKAIEEKRIKDEQLLRSIKLGVEVGGVLVCARE
jgi:hypothetical protein